jgi:hypothetical protein
MQFGLTHDNCFHIVVILGLGSAIGTGFLVSEKAALSGRIPLLPDNMNPLTFGVSGGIATLLIVMTISYLLACMNLPPEKLDIEKFMDLVVKDEDHQNNAAMSLCMDDKQFRDFFPNLNEQFLAFKGKHNLTNYIRLTSGLTNHSMKVISSVSKEYPNLDKEDLRPTPHGSTLRGWVSVLVSVRVPATLGGGRPKDVPVQDWPEELSVQEWLVFISYFEGGQRPENIALGEKIDGMFKEKGPFGRLDPNLLHEVFSLVKEKYKDRAFSEYENQRRFFNDVLRGLYTKWYIKSKDYNHAKAIDDVLKPEIAKRVENLILRTP